MEHCFLITSARFCIFCEKLMPPYLLAQESLHGRDCQLGLSFLKL